MCPAPRRFRRGLSGRARILAGAALLAVFAAGLYFGIELAKPPPPPDLSRLAPSLEPPSAGEAYRAEEGPRSPEAADEPEFDGLEPEAPAAEPAARRWQPSAGEPRVAIVIDDLGRSLHEVEALAGLGIDLTYAVLPFESRTAEVVAALRSRGAELLCHLPMEAKGGANPGPGALRLAMSERELEAATREALAAVPGAAGVNNHMGSGITSRREAIRAVLGVLAERGLYYLDSRTSAETLGFTIARSLGVPSAERQVFLDNDRDPAAIRAQFERLLALARASGAAIAIAHPYPQTLEVLASEIPRARAEGIHFVPASRLVEGG